jgi:DNA-directed RNA polymerase subunit L
MAETMAKPRVNIIATDDPAVFKFQLLFTDTSVANAIRRTILTDIPILAMQTFLDDNNIITISKNTSRFNNEFIKQRLSCIPIMFPKPYNDDDEKEFNETIEYLIENYEIKLNVKNDNRDDKHIKYITTEDFKIINKQSEENEDKLAKIMFQKSPITNEYILLARLRPSMSEDIDGEELEFTTKLKMSKAKDNSCYNATHTCYYKCIVDKEKAKEEWKKKLEKLKKKEKITLEEIKVIEKDWNILDRNRIIRPNEFEFTIETIGQYTNEFLVRKACNIIMEKLDIFITSIKEEDNKLINKSDNTIPHCYDITLKNEDYTIGNILEYMLYYIYYNNKSSDNINLIFCGFKKPHPHINDSIIKIAFENEISNEDIIKILELVVENLKNNIFNIILNEIKI